MSLNAAAVLDAAVGPYQGKQSGEPPLLAALLGGGRALEPGDVLLADRCYASYCLIAALLARGVDCVMRLHQRRTADFRTGTRLGREDHVVTWLKPADPPDWMARAAFDALPAELAVREARARNGVGVRLDQ